MPRVWVQKSGTQNEEVIVARLTLTSSQLIVECDGRDRLDDVKHRLAGVFGFALHFRKETLMPPYRRITLEELQSEQPVRVIVSQEDDRNMLQAFLEKAYLEWSDQPHGMLGGKTPRHAAASAATREVVAHLIMEMEATDPGVRRNGQRAYDYNILRGHVGLDDRL